MSIKNTRGYSTNEITEQQIDIDADLSVGFVDASGSYNSENELVNNFSTTKKIARTQIFSPTKKPYLPDGLVWYAHEQTWQQLFQQRTNGNILKHMETISSVQNKVISSNELSEIQVDFENLLVSVGASLNQNIKSNFSEKEVTEWEIDIEFAPIEDLTGENLTKQVQEVDNISKDEQRYVEDLKFMLEDDDRIDEDERKMLERKREKYGIDKLRAEELEKSLITSTDLTAEEQEYIEELKECETEGKVSDGDRRILIRLADKLGIPEERTIELENIVFKSKKEKIYTEKELKYIEEIKFCLEDDGEISASERRMLNKERDKLQISVERAEEIEQEFIREIEK